jgi:hypothetical protein
MKSRKMKWAGYVASTGGKLKRRDHSEDIYVWMGDIIRMDLREIGWEVVDWIHLADRCQWRVVVNTAKNVVVP